MMMDCFADVLQGPWYPLKNHWSAQRIWTSLLAKFIAPLVTVYPHSDESVQCDNAPCHWAHIITEWLQEHDSKVFTAAVVPRPPPDRELLGWGGGYKSKKVCNAKHWYDNFAQWCRTHVLETSWQTRRDTFQDKGWYTSSVKLKPDKRALLKQT